MLELTPRRLLLACAAVAALGLLSAHVGLLQDTVARGAQWRVDHQATAGTASARAAPASLAVRDAAR